MRLADLIDRPSGPASDAAGVEIRGLTADSREVAPGFLFAALPGAKADGATFAAQAVASGAVAILAAETAAIPPDVAAQVPVLRVAEPRAAFSRAAARFYPEQPATIVAVTGTSGKTSVASFTRQIFEAAGHAAASLGTLGVTAPGRETYGALTTPDPVSLHRLLDELARSGVTHLAMEASSHGLDQHRLDGVRLEAAGFTNLGRDHLDYHPTVEDYLAAKLRLFTDLLPPDGTAVIWMDSDEGRQVASVARQRGLDVIEAGRDGRHIRLVELVPDGFRQLLRLEIDGARHEVVLPLAGAFQASNALVALGLSIAVGVPADRALQALAGLEGARGRLELAGSTREGGLVFVDYAHKPDALEHVLSALRPFAKGRLAVVFGAGGDRDHGKRPIMGEVAERLADRVYITDDNPRSEDPASIRAAILAGAPGAVEIGDRREAIRRAMADLRDGDILVVAGKGHETGQIAGERVLPFSDHAVVAEALQEEPA